MFRSQIAVSIVISLPRKRETTGTIWRTLTTISSAFRFQTVYQIRCFYRIVRFPNSATAVRANYKVWSLSGLITIVVRSLLDLVLPNIINKYCAISQCGATKQVHTGLKDTQYINYLVLIGVNGVNCHLIPIKTCSCLDGRYNIVQCTDTASRYEFYNVSESDSSVYCDKSPTKTRNNWNHLENTHHNIVCFSLPNRLPNTVLLSNSPIPEFGDRSSSKL